MSDIPDRLETLTRYLISLTEQHQQQVEHMLATTETDPYLLGQWFLGSTLQPSTPYTDAGRVELQRLGPTAWQHRPLQTADDLLSWTGTALAQDRACAEWQDRSDDIHFDALARPGAYRHLAALALCLEALLDTEDGHALEGVLAILGNTPLADDGPAPENLFETMRQQQPQRPTQTWLAWAERCRPRHLAPAVRKLQDQHLPLAASDEAPDALARVSVGNLLAGELTLAITPSGILLEWCGDAEPPDDMQINARVLSLASPAASLADAAWILDEPPQGAWQIQGSRGNSRDTLTWKP